MNIVSMAMKYLTPMLVDRIATSLGIQSPLVRSAIAAILPTILAGITGVASKPGGGRQLGEVLSKQNTDILGDLGSIFGGAQQTEIAKKGNDALGDLLGGGAFKGLTGAVGKFAGLGDGATQSLVGMMAPVVLGTLAKQQKDAGLDAAGLTSMLMGQRENIQAAMPAGLSDLLKGTGLLDGLSAPSPAAKVQEAARPAAKSNSLGMWPMVAAAVALAVLGYYYFGQQRQLATAIPAAPTITVGNQNIGAQLGSLAESLRGTVGGIRDQATAREAMPKLQAMADQLSGIQNTAAGLQPDARRTLASYAAQLLPLLRPVLEKALQSAGVGPVAKPILDQIIGRLETLAKS
jgi:hypothetical protein